MLRPPRPTAMPSAGPRCQDGQRACLCLWLCCCPELQRWCCCLPRRRRRRRSERQPPRGAAAAVVSGPSRPPAVQRALRPEMRGPRPLMLYQTASTAAVPGPLPLAGRCPACRRGNIAGLLFSRNPYALSKRMLEIMCREVVPPAGVNYSDGCVRTWTHAHLSQRLPRQRLLQQRTVSGCGPGLLWASAHRRWLHSPADIAAPAADAVTMFSRTESSVMQCCWLGCSEYAPAQESASQCHFQQHC
jgi:hypothetical protein